MARGRPRCEICTSLTGASDVRQLIALVRKDWMLHWRSVAAFCVGFIALAHALTWLLPPLPQPGLALPPVVTVPVALSFVLTCVTWLVERERSRETFALLRALPVSDLQIVGSKYLAYVLMQLAGLAFVLVTTPVGAYLSPMQVVTTFMGILTFASLCLAAQLSFTHRKAGVAPVILLLVVAVGAARLGQSHAIVSQLVSRWRQPWLHASLWAVCVTVTAGCLIAAYLRVRSQDTEDLIG